MADRKRTKSEERSYVELIDEIFQLEIWHRQNQLKLRHIPEGWEGIEAAHPCRRRKSKLTANFDSDVVKWFRAMGHGYQARMNAVLRIYMLSVVSKEIRRRGDKHWKGDPI